MSDRDDSSSDSGGFELPRKKRARLEEQSRVPLNEALSSFAGASQSTSGDSTQPARRSARAVAPAAPLAQAPQASTGDGTDSSAFSWKVFIASWDPEVAVAHADAAQAFLTHADVDMLSPAALAQSSYEDLSSVSVMPTHVRAKALIRECVVRAKALHAARAQEYEAAARGENSNVASAQLSGMLERVATAEEEELVQLVGGKSASSLTVARFVARPTFPRCSASAAVVKAQSARALSHGRRSPV